MASPTIYSRNLWPDLLCELPESSQPKTLYLRGTPPPRDALIIGIVGTRKATAYGKEITTEVVRTLRPLGVVIASGLALGIDTVAHKSALEFGLPTVAVLGSGLDEQSLYPKENTDLARHIEISRGALLSEYAPGTKPASWTFPQRNRIIAGISKAIIVIEAGEKSGARITARFANEFGRDVLAVPGPIWSAQSRGTNLLIKEGATPILSPSEIPELLGIVSSTETPRSVLSSESFTPEEAEILGTLDEARSLDEIIRKTNLSATAVLAVATNLEIRGIIKGIGNGMYRKLL